MRRFVPLLGLLALCAPAAAAHAEETPTDKTLAVAEAAGVDAHQLQGAVNTVAEAGLDPDPVEYAFSAGLIARPAPPPPPPVRAAIAAPAPAAGAWDRVVRCESGGNWRAATGNGYYGGLQEDMAFWRNHGGLAYADRPDHASPAAQIQVAINGRDGLVGQAQGMGAWPVCGRR